MITDKKSLKEYIKSDNAWLLPKGAKQRLIALIAAYPTRELKKFLKYLRYQEYYINSASQNPFKGILAIYFEGRKNRLGQKLGIELPPNCAGKGLNLYHGGSIIINPKVKAGENLKLHGSNCIGNDGKSDAAPTIGNNVDIGFGAVLIGDIAIADNIKIGANALVNRSFTEPGCTIAGVPARVVRKADDEG